RSISNVISGGFGTTTAAAPAQADEPGGVHMETTADMVAQKLSDAKEVIIVPGYGLAVAKAQYAIAELTKTLTDNGVKVMSAC
ncbi:unnamed protein product, partial [Discosporangium mesarthrocarpum]